MKVIKEDMDQSLKEESLEDQEDLDPEDGEKEETVETEANPDREEKIPETGEIKNIEMVSIFVENNKSSSQKMRGMSKPSLTAVVLQL